MLGIIRPLVTRRSSTSRWLVQLGPAPATTICLLRQVLSLSSRADARPHLLVRADAGGPTGTAAGLMKADSPKGNDMDPRASRPEDWTRPPAAAASDLRPGPGAPRRQPPGRPPAAPAAGRHGAHRARTSRRLRRATTPGGLRVPEITAYFWVIKGLSTAMGESTSDFLVHVMNPVLAVGLGFVGFVIALALQFSVRRYIAWTYWFAVLMVGVFGTMAADVLHVGFGVPYTVSSTLYAIVLAVVFLSWQRTEKTLSIHSIDTPRREAFYWAAVVATFAM